MNYRYLEVLKLNYCYLEAEKFGSQLFGAQTNLVRATWSANILIHCI